jgi:dynein heavy chain
VVGPKEKKLAEALETLQKVEAVLSEKMQGLHEVQEQVSTLNRNLQESLLRAKQLQTQMTQAEQQLERAEKLLGGLSSESERWQLSVDKLQEDLTNMTGNIMLSSAFVSYLGPFTAEYRKMAIDKWIRMFIDRGIPTSKDYDLQRILSDENQIREWQDYELPADQLSTENGILIFNTRRWPLIIDPQNQANNWIRKLQGGNNIQIGKLSDQNFSKTLENCIRFGSPCLLENVEEELDPMLDPVLQKQTFKKGPQVLLKLGDQDIPYHNDFRY